MSASTHTATPIDVGELVEETTATGAATSKEEAVEGRAIQTTNATSLFWRFDDFQARGTVIRIVPARSGVTVRHDSQVAVSICELSSTGFPFIGDAQMSVLNVAPRNDGTVAVRLNVGWPDLLRVRLNLVIVN